ncbi:MAG: hypothetical protein KC636_31655 [Myxococcales bacterium]|nr:hypothetical protein [Myxococcales bacterium]
MVDAAQRDEDEGPSPREVIARHRVLVRRTERALLVLALAIVALVIFHNPRAWGDGRAAALVRVVAWVAVLIAGLVAYVANGRAAERRGYCLGRFGAPPNKLSEESDKKR